MFIVCNSMQAQEIRLSFKVILDPNTGNRPSYATEEFFNDAMTFMNEVICKSGRGMKFSKEATIEIGGKNHSISKKYYSANPIDKTVSPHWLIQLETDAQNNTATYFWRQNRINIYFNGGGGGGVCSLPNYASNQDEASLIGSGSMVTILHEVGHFFNLCHTQGCDCNSCDTCNKSKSDKINDTLEDLACWSRDSIATNAFGKNYNGLTLTQQKQVDDTYNNVMSYHFGDRDRLTELQLDRWVQSIFEYQSRKDVVSSLPIYVDDNKGCVEVNCIASPLEPIKYIDPAIDKLETTSNRNILVLKPGNYNIKDNRIIKTNCVITGTGGGNAIIK